MSPTKHTTDFYVILEVSPKASQEEIARAYKKLVARYHPDRHQGNELEKLAEEKLAQINEAYEVLSDPRKRADYNGMLSGRPGLRPGPFPSRQPSSTGPPVFLRPVILLLVVAAGGFLLRFMRNPRAFAMVVGLVVVIWISRVIVRKYYDD